MTHRLLLMYTLDPRGRKIGGIETHVRLLLARHPPDFEIVFVGIDEIGDCRLGVPFPVAVGGRTISFVPVAHVAGEAVNRAAKRLGQSTTLRYVLGCLRHVSTLRRLVGGRPASADLHRFEFAPIARLLGLPAVQMVHGEGSRRDKMDSLIKRYWFIHALNERLALALASRILCVNGTILDRLGTIMPKAAAKADVMSVPVDTAVFRPTPFDLSDDVLRIVFAGRLDAFKDPPLLFSTIARLKALRFGRVEFHYVGASDPTRFAEYAPVADVVVRHGALDADGVARVMAHCHLGLLASFFEGMPCFLLETLAAGRAFAAIRLPQFDPLVEAGVSGALVERADDPEESAERLATACLQLHAAIVAGRLQPVDIAAKAEPFSVTRQLDRLFAIHRHLQGRQQPARYSQEGREADPAAMTSSTTAS